MRILMLCTDAFGGHGGIALYNRDLAAALALHPMVDEVVVLPRVISGAVEPLPSGVTFIDAAARGAPAYLAAAARAARTRPDLVISGHVNLMPIAATMARPVLFAWGIDVWRPVRKPGFARAMRRCRAVVSISECTRQRFEGWSGYSGPAYLLPNAIRTENYGLRGRRADLAERFGLRSSRCILTVGRLDARERYKGIDEVLEVMPDLPSDISYIVAGDGTDLARLKEKAAALGLGSRVVFTGRFSEEDKADLYALADAYVMPGRGEGFGFVFLEALASGVPVVGSILDGSRDALRGGELGRLVDPTNRAEVRAAIVEVLARPKEIPPGLDYFSFSHFTQRAHAIIDDVLVR